MHAAARETFSAEVDSETLDQIRALAEAEGRQLHALVEEALTDLLEKRRNEWPRAHAIAAYQESHEVYSPLYRKLAE